MCKTNKSCKTLEQKKDQTPVDWLISHSISSNNTTCDNCEEED